MVLSVINALPRNQPLMALFRDDATKKHRDLKTNHIGKNEPCDEKDVLLEKGVLVSLLC